MSRLTMTSPQGGVALTFDLDVTCKISEMRKLLKVFEKLKEYEDLEEQGLLLKLPCKVGDKYFRILYGEIYENEFNNRATMVSMLDDGAFGKTVFLTKEDAEQELEKIV